MLNTQLFHFLVEPTACIGQKGSCLSRVTSSLSFHPKYCFVFLISTHTHTECWNKEHGEFLFLFPSLHFRLHVPKTHRLQTPNKISVPVSSFSFSNLWAMVYEIFSSSSILKEPLNTQILVETHLHQTPFSVSSR